MSKVNWRDNVDWLDDIEYFKMWLNEVDAENLLDSFDVALGWFSGHGYTHQAACDAATYMQEIRPVRKSKM